jgi:hypothetical protein
MNLKNPALYEEQKTIDQSVYDTKRPGCGHLVRSAANKIFYNTI